VRLEEDRTAHLPSAKKVLAALIIVVGVLVTVVVGGAVIATAISVMARADEAPDTYVVNPAYVRDIYDGDTFYITVPECAELLASLCQRLGVRVNGIDTPEMHGKCQWERDHALAAKAVTVNMIAAAKTIVLTHVQREKFGRLLATVEIDGVDLGATLIKGGYARPYHGEARSGWCEGKEI
jgi:endonuclease YncB( thermonuclease family)